MSSGGERMRPTGREQSDGGAVIAAGGPGSAAAPESPARPAPADAGAAGGDRPTERQEPRGAGAAAASGPRIHSGDDGAGRLIASLQLQPHPEGGWYRELHRSAVSVERASDGGRRTGLTLIAYLLLEGETSRWHRVRGSDELWVHAAGAPLDLWCLPPEGGEARLLGLGSLTLDTATRSGPDEGCGDAPDGAGGVDAPTRVIAADWWQAARSRGAWSLVHCAVGPGFAFEDFELLAERPLERRPHGARVDLL